MLTRFSFSTAFDDWPQARVLVLVGSDIDPCVRRHDEVKHSKHGKQRRHDAKIRGPMTDVYQYISRTGVMMDGNGKPTRDTAIGLFYHRRGITIFFWYLQREIGITLWKWRSGRRGKTITRMEGARRNYPSLQ